MGYHKATHYIVAALMIAVSFSSSQEKNNVLREAKSCKEKSPEQGSSVSVWNCYDVWRNCFHYGKAGCSKDLYKGKEGSTLFGNRCQNWNAKRPRKHNKHHDLPENYCRNPDESDGPWCYTTNPHRTWDYCFIDCAAHDCFDSNRGCFHYGKARCQKRYMYKGKRSHTFDGIECQAWSSKGLYYSYLANNYCVNPDGNEKGPWCYATKKIANKNWDYCFQDCAVDDCYDSRRKCFHYGKSECKKKYLYNGTRSYTFNGVKCQKWNTKASKYNHVAENYCRDVWGNEEAPWCYATKRIQGKDWDYCLSDCSADDCYDSHRNCFHYGKAGCKSRYMYNGTRSYTFDGIKCREWRAEGQYHYLAKNYCSNPDGSEGPWCFSTKPVGDRVWDYCLTDCAGDNCFMYNGLRQCYSREEICQKRYVYNGSRNFNLDQHRCLKWSSADYFKYLPGSFCRNPNKRKAPWCYTEGKIGQWNYCYEEECDMGTCYDSDRGCFHYERADCKEPDSYTGTRDFTISGSKCLNWSSAQISGKFIHKNYCRITPGTSGPWCMVRDGSDYCFPRCDEDRCYDRSRDCFHYGKPECSAANSYIGTRSYALNRRACHYRHYDNQMAGNLCRDPQGSKKGPWCPITRFTREWDYCFKDCNADRCYDSSEDCFRSDRPGCTALTSYIGTKHHTAGDLECVPWSTHGIKLPSNYCRRLHGTTSPIDYLVPWCYGSRESNYRYLCFAACFQRNLRDGVSCGLFQIQSECRSEARKCKKETHIGGLIYQCVKGRCDLVKGVWYQCVCYTRICSA